MLKKVNYSGLRFFSFLLHNSEKDYPPLRSNLQNK
ncbi:unnamed protein product [Brassica napus]|uniref:(rape) hypothetical protein n=1 Tax=Brassica napus TaxID=3708 RepID=A0A816JKH2_BRANA|nr:unnamed protein product [Brassica napus]